MANKMSARRRTLFQSKNHAVLLSDKTRCREVECREGMLVQVITLSRPDREREREGRKRESLHL